MALGLFALIPVRKAYEGEAVRPFEYVLYAAAFLFLYASMFLTAFLLYRQVYPGLGERSRRLLFRLLACAGGLGALMNAVYIIAYDFRYGH